jgi:MFS transporter, ACS family, hexuronate transporter
VGFGGAIGGIAFGQTAGYLLDHGYGYQMVFTLVGTFHILALLTILVFIPNIRPIEMNRKPCYEGAI